MTGPDPHNPNGAPSHPARDRHWWGDWPFLKPGYWHWPHRLPHYQPEYPFPQPPGVIPDDEPPGSVYA